MIGKLLLIFTIIFTCFPSFAWFWENCSKGENSVVGESGLFGSKVTVCNGGGSSIIKRSSDGNKTTLFFASGIPAENITRTELLAEEKKAKEHIQKFMNSDAQQAVYPIVALDDKDPIILGTALRYGDIILTALHVVSESTDKKLFIFDALTNQYLQVTGYAPLYHESNEKLTYYEDFCVLELDRRNVSRNISLPNNLVQKNFNYVELSYPVGKNSILQPTVTSSHSSHPETSTSHLIILNRSGQDFLSSGGAVYDLDNNDRLVGMSICIDESNAVRTLSLDRLNGRIQKALQQGFLSDLSGLKFDFKFLTECRPIGGRRGGG